MAWAATWEHETATDPSLNVFAASRREDFLREARESDYIVVELASPGSAIRGRLALFIEGAIERMLEARAAPPPGTAPSAKFFESAYDQLERARRSGAQGLALSFDPLDGIATASRELDTQDSAVIRWWLHATREHPVKLQFAETDRNLGVYDDPLRLGQLLESQALRLGDEAIVPRAEAYPSAAAADGCRSSTEPDASPPVEATAAPGLRAGEAEELSESARAMAEELGEADAGWLRETLLQLSTPPPADPVSEAVAETAAPAVAEDTPSDETAGEPRDEVAASDLGELPVKLELTPADPADFFAGTVDVEPDTAGEDEFDANGPRAPGASLETPERAPAPSARHQQEIFRQCESWSRELESANGPKPLSVVERLFVSAYVPLRDALTRGLAPKSAESVLEDWSLNFERSYTEAFDALRVRNKRPKMVLDIPEVALRVARLHGARSTQLLLVDGMRFDLGMKMHERLKEEVGQEAACAEQLLLWSALPTTTATQVELIGRGPAGLKDFTGEVDDDLLVTHGRKAAMIRRLRTGHREVLKLDLVEANLAEPGLEEAERIDALAGELAERIALHLRGVPERTLVMVFGDHGFLLDARNGGTTKARQGGATPEEVLVPAYGWIVGPVH